MTFPAFTGYSWAAKLHNDTYDTISPAYNSQKGRIVFITGASRGIGRATAVAFAQEGAAGIILGARSSLEESVAVVLNAAEGSGHPKPKILTLQLDVANTAEVEAAAKQVSSTFGQLDVLINNAGRLDPWINIADTDPAQWWRTWEVNINGVYLVTRFFLPLLLKGECKTIINLSSVGAHLVRPGASSYQTAKLAAIRFTECTAAEYSSQGIVAFSLHPGAILTDMTRDLPPDAQARMKDSPELAADTMVFLTTEKRAWLNGRFVSANWDMGEFLSRKQEIVDGDKLKVRLVL